MLVYILEVPLTKTYFKSWLVELRILRRFSGISAISRLASRRLPISEIQVTRPGIEPRTSCSASQELNHSTNAAPISTYITFCLHIAGYKTFSSAFVRRCTYGNPMHKSGVHCILSILSEIFAETIRSIVQC